MEPLVLHEELEDGRLGEGDADDAFERYKFVGDFVLFQFGRHAAGEPDNAQDAYRCDDGFDDAEGGCGSRELVFERTHDGSEGPYRDVQGQLGGEDLEDHDPNHLDQN